MKGLRIATSKMVNRTRKRANNKALMEKTTRAAMAKNGKVNGARRIADG